jgi:hypothetical protein
MKEIKINYSKKVPAMAMLLTIPLIGALAYFAAYYGGNMGFVCGASAFVMFRLGYEIIKGWNRITINDECVVVNSKYQWTVCFRDVEDFYPVTYKGQYLIGIHYKQSHENYRTDDYLDDTRETRMGYELSPGAPYEIPTRGLSIKPQELLKQLNERLHLEKMTGRTD